MTRWRRDVLGVAIVIVLAACGATTAAQPRAVLVTEARVEVGSAIGDNPQVVVTLMMTSSADDELIGAAVPANVAAKATVEGSVSSPAGHLGHLDAPGAPPHTHTTTDRIKLPKGVAVQLKAGIGRIVLDQIVKPIRSGDHFALTLTFASGTTQTVTVIAKTQSSTGGTQQFAVVVGGTEPNTGTVTQGTLVSITVSNPAADDEFHLHGYDLTESVLAGKTATFTFVATDTGTFPVESHTSSATLFTLLVQPM